MAGEVREAERPHQSPLKSVAAVGGAQVHSTHVLQPNPVGFVLCSYVTNKLGSIFTALPKEMENT